MSDRSRKFYIGLALALGGYTTMMLTAATGNDATIFVWITQVSVIFFVVGVVVMLLTA